MRGLRLLQIARGTSEAARGVTWASALPEILAALVVLAVPGLVLGALLRVRGIALAAAAPALSVGILVLGSVLLGMLGVPWGPASFGAVTLASWTAAAALRRHFPAPTPVPHSRRRTVGWAFSLGVALGGGLLCTQLFTALIDPNNISQHFDVVFHLNAVRHILDTGDASPLTLGRINGGTGVLSFYPSAWHALVALVVDGTGGTLPVAVAALNLVVAAAAWPIGCAALVRVIAGRRPLPVLLAGVFSAAVGSFPLMMLDWGVLYANFLGVSLLPALVATVVALCGMGTEQPFARPTLAALLLIEVAGAVGSHPSSLPALIVLTVPVLVAAEVRRVRALRGSGVGRSRFRRDAIVVPATALAIAAVWSLLRPANGFAGWDPPLTPGRALLGALTGSFTSGTVPWLVAGSIALATVLAVLGRLPGWLAASYGLVAVLFLVVAAVPRSPVRTALTGIWYEDVYRIVALSAVAAVPLAALGAGWVAERAYRLVAARWEPPRAFRTPPATIAGFAVIGVLAAALSQGPHVERQVEKTQDGYRFDAHSAILTPDELRMIERLPALVPADAVIADNPWDGSALAYALGRRQVMVTHMLAVLSPDQHLVADGLRDAHVDGRVCAAAARLGVRYALDFGAYLDDDPAARLYPGLAGLDTSKAVALVASEGRARLYRLLPCVSG